MSERVREGREMERKTNEIFHSCKSRKVENEQKSTFSISFLILETVLYEMLLKTYIKVL